MRVRNDTFKKTEYKGHEFYASGVFCPCRPCVNCHDCGSYYGGEYHERFECATRFNTGCPQPKPEPTHKLNRQGRCIRCNTYPNRMSEEDYSHIRS